MKDKFIEALKNGTKETIKSKMRDSVKSRTHFEVEGHKFIVEIENLLSWTHLLHAGLSNQVIDANLLVYPKDSGDEHYVYCTLDIMESLGINGIQNDLNKYVNNIANDLKLTKEDLDYTVGIFNERTEGFNRTINRYSEVNTNG